MMGNCLTCERSATAPGTCDRCIETGRHELEARSAPTKLAVPTTPAWWPRMLDSEYVPGPMGLFPFRGATGPYIDPRQLALGGPTGPTGPR
jgi:hypothetical protein